MTGERDKMPTMCNNDCGIWCISGYFANCCGIPMNFVPVMLKRTRLRHYYKIEGSMAEDCLASWFCHPCTLAQLETEQKDRGPGPVVNQQPQSSQPSMTYAPPGEQGRIQPSQPEMPLSGNRGEAPSYRPNDDGVRHVQIL
jgi:Cys-rich protein (TIGR01571 family)